MAYTSSTVTKGRAKGIVVSIGMKTEIGAIAESLRGGDTRVRKVSRSFIQSRLFIEGATAHQIRNDANDIAEIDRSERMKTVTRLGIAMCRPGDSPSGT